MAVGRFNPVATVFEVAPTRHTHDDARIGRQEQACAELVTAIELYRVMDMTFWLPRQRRHWRRQAEQRGQREEFLEALPPRPA